MNPLRILADEDVDASIVNWLRASGVDVAWACECASGARDEALAFLAARDNRIILTRDRDFGYLVVHRGIPVPGVCYLRLLARTTTERLAAFTKWWPSATPNLAGNFTVIKMSGVRIRPLPK